MKILFSKPAMIGGLIVLAALILSTSHLVAQTSKNNATATKADGSRTPAASKSVAGRSGKDGNSFSPQGNGSAVKGTGTAGMIPKWLDSTTIGDSIISEAAGNIGIGTTTPGSKLSVAGMIETTMGGYKFPDGTIQSTAAMSGLAAVVHDSTLNGSGTSGSPLGISVPLTIDGTAAGTFPVLRVRGKSDDFPGVMSVTDETPLGPDASGIALSVRSHNWIAISGVGPVVGVEGASIGDLSTAVRGHAVGDGATAFRGTCIGTNCNAGQFHGNVQVTGTLTKGGGSFRIDHPLDPETKYLSHSFVESPDMMNIYNGNVTLDSNGEAVVDLPDWYSALNRDARYLLTAIGAPGPSLYIAKKIFDNRFKIAGGQPGMEVSWQVTGIRRDAWADKNRIPVEELKSDIERGHYLHPELFNQPEEKSIEWARNPELMRKMKQERQQKQRNQ